MFNTYDKDNGEELRIRLIAILRKKGLDKEEAEKCLELMLETMQNYYGDVVLELIERA